MTKILEDVKEALGVDVNNLGFDNELLIYINATKSTLVQLGLSEFELVSIDHTTEWPNFTNDTIGSLIKQYFVLDTKMMFDPSGSETVNQSIRTAIIGLDNRIRHELGEIANV